MKHRKKLYYMHPMNTYGTDLEREQLLVISRLFPDWEVVNPSEAKHVEAANQLEKDGAYVMGYFTELAASCQGGAALPFRDGKLGAGVFKEIETLRKRGYPVWLITCDFVLSEFDFGRDRSLELSVDETRNRIRNEDRSTRPY